MKIIFAGTPDFAAVALSKLIISTHEIVAVYTQPDRPAGRGLKLTPSAVKTLATAHNLPVYQPASLKEASEQDQLKSFSADVMVVAAYGLLLPQAVLSIPKYGCINIHPSLLPRWRGAAPIQRTIFSGDQLTGVTIMQMDTGLDTGPMLLQHQYALAEDETTQSLHDKLAKMGADSLLETLDLLAKNQLKPIAQDDSLATYATKITKDEALINWTQPGQTIERNIRAFNPWPMAYTHLNGERLRIGAARYQEIKRTEAPGTIVSASSAGIDVVTGDQSILTLLAVQLPGGKMLPVTDFYNAKRNILQIGTQLA